MDSVFNFNLEDFEIQEPLFGTELTGIDMALPEMECDFSKLETELTTLQPAVPADAQPGDQFLNLNDASFYNLLGSSSIDEPIIPYANHDVSQVVFSPVQRVDMLPASPAGTVVSTVSSEPASPVSVSLELSPGSPNVVCEAALEPKKRGRGRRPNPEGAVSKRRRPKKPKKYELGPQYDAEEEKKRLNALNAKLHREKARKAKEEMEAKLKALAKDKDYLLKEVQELRERETLLQQQVQTLLANQPSVLVLQNKEFTLLTETGIPVQ